MLKQFVAANDLAGEAQDTQFEHFAAFVTLRRHHTRSFDTGDVVTGSGGDTGIDSAAVIVNGALVTDFDAANDLIQRNGFIDATFVFTQAERTSGFDAAKAGTFGFGVEDFFKEEPTLVRNGRIAEVATYVRTLYERGTQFKNKPACRLYYVTTGNWADDQNIMARVNGAKQALHATSLFSVVEFQCLGADQIHKLYNQTKNAISREFVFKERTEIPAVDGIIQAYLGYVPANELMRLISDDSGDDILGNIFDENIRDWQDFNEVNKEIRETLRSDHRGRFVLMNNGVTIITRDLQQMFGSTFKLENFQIVNGCQTSNVLFAERDKLDNVSVPLRLIQTQDEQVIEDIIYATNQQTQLRPEQLYALTDSSKGLEKFFPTYPDPHKLYYERRDCQYDRETIERKRIIGPQALIRAFASMFLDEPVRATRQYKSIRDMVGEKIFRRGDKYEPYYVAAYAAYRLDALFRSKKLGGEFKPARYHILMVLRYLMDGEKLPWLNSKKMAQRAEAMIKVLWDSAKSEKLIVDAAEMVWDVVGTPFDRDRIRIEPVKEALLEKLGA